MAYDPIRFADKYQLAVQTAMNDNPGGGLCGFELELAYCNTQGLELQISLMGNGIICDPANPYLQSLLQTVRQVSGQEPLVGRKLPGTSARFAPQGQGVVWGQAGIGPHAKDERHYIPSIEPYYQALQAYGDLLKERSTP